MKKLLLERYRRDANLQSAMPPPRGEIAAPPAVRENHHDGQTSSRQNAVSRKPCIVIRDRENENKRKHEDEDDRPSVPIEGIRGLWHAVESRGGTGVMFLYKTKLASSDLAKTWLVVTREEKVREFLRADEVAAVDGLGEGLTVVGVDGRRVYPNLHIKNWGGRNLVIKTEWKYVVNHNNATNGDSMEVWGYRENGKACLAFNFIREGADSSTSNVRRGKSVRFSLG